ncbi:MAG: MmgE/PrpD family protein [Lentisphaerae bacterium]|jgi:2-methylcitrate dehydratase PrpD|nr:MmgE/PrpD family protein [Lentisphaerota bacterium]MBT4818581.1 MmgE/PrpD family protein [Lentisphaerota bacterium]MBT5609364.1 MmgE/PrpD family protein [Lentisphaerota bacterium]MBT7057246.1 MmgE/PrpD family protein [Lentisphaerota bacterium]MBT7843509.1 MmgE/PrpD family protein [Lentisphaerota bacterium]
MSLTKALTEMALNTRAEDIPEAAYDAVRLLVLDTVGVTIGGYNTGGIPESMEQMRDWGGKPEASVLIYGGKLPAPQAAFANSAMSHAQDYDHTHQMGVGHVMVSLFPVCLAAAEMTGASGSDFLAALILGQEVTCRLGVAWRNQKVKGGYPSLGFLPASVVGGFGTTAAACRLFGMDVDQTVNALGVNYAQASGNRQALFDKTLTKRLQPAFAARSALWATALASRGVTGPPNALEGRAGMFAVFRHADPCTLEDLMAPREFYEVQRDSIKPHPCCCVSDAHVAVLLGQQHDFKLEDIEHIQVHMTGHGLTGGPFELGDDPQVSVQFSTAYCAALGVLRGRMGLAEIADEQVLADTEVLELASKVVLEPMADLPEPEPVDPSLIEWTPGGNRNHGVKVRTRDGRTHTCFRTHRDCLGPENMTFEMVSRKFHECAAFSGICSPSGADTIIESIMGLGEADGVTPLIDVIADNTRVTR